MQPQNTDYKQLLTEVIKKQIVILGPDITLAKARNVKGLTISDDGTVTEISGPPQELIQSLVDQFVQLSGLIVKKTMEPLLVGFPLQNMPVAPVVPPQVQPTPQAQVAPTTEQPVTPTPQSQTPTQPVAQSIPNLPVTGN